MGLFIVDVMRGDAQVKRSSVKAERFMDAAKAVTTRPVKPGAKHEGDWILVTQYVSDRTEEFVFGD